MTQLIIFTDLDGTLLEYKTYSYTPAKPALQNIHKKNIPLIFSTSKTRLEIEYWQKKLNIHHPFISENGGGLFIPKDYFSFNYDYHKSINNFKVIEFGIPYTTLLGTIKKLQKHFHLRSFADMTPEELSHEAGLSIEQAVMALQRDYEVPFQLLNITEKKDILNMISKQNLSVMIGGKYIHLMGNQTKGAAVTHLLKLYSQQFPSIKTIAIGDTHNDFSMLNVVDIPYLVQQPDGSYITDDYHHAKGIGPTGWYSAVSFELQNHR